jgi:coenzyme Q-binding protein COQ10
MPSHAEKRLLPYRAQDLYDLVSDIERYPEFLPWCIAARITHRQENIVFADLIIGFKALRERFSSKVILSEGRIDVTYCQGPFKYLNNHWIFEEISEFETMIDFYVDFEFQSRLLQMIMTPLFGEAVRLMVGAFEKRAKIKFGTHIHTK